MIYQSEFAKQTLTDNQQLIIRKSCKDFLIIKLYRLTIRKVTKEEKEDDKESSIDMIGGILIIILEEVDVCIKNNKLKLDNTRKFDLDNSNKIFIDNKYLKKYNTVSDKILKTISFKFSINKIDGGFTINRLSHFL